MLKQNLQQKLLQKLSPQQIQMIKLLELPTLQLEQRIKKELEENPALDEGNEDEDDYSADDNQDNDDTQNDEDDEFSFEEYIGDDDDIPSYRLNANNTSKDDEQRDIPFSSSKSFHEHLSDQLMLKDVDDKEKLLAVFIIGNIDEDGYLRREIEAIVDDIAFSQNIEVEEEDLRRVLEVVQELDPAGVGAQNLQECLMLQLERKENNIDTATLAKKIIGSCFDEFTKKHYTKIMSKCSVDEAELKAAIDFILKLNPKPGSSFGEPQTRSAQSIIPDFILDIVDNEIVISLNSRNAPELRISRNFSQMMEDYAKNKKKKKSDKEALVFIKQKLDSAKWFIDAIVQRQNTLLFSMNAIADFQKDFFLSGDETELKPMILKDIAEITGLDISTISRVANSKYVATPYGNYLLKYFFSEGMLTESGEEVSTREIKQILKDCIDVESKSKPLTDDKLAEILKSKGYQIARRTVAKYREQLDIPVARLRKEL
ncbi:MAG: RNA polymerase factor sigma-54 [Bacteroidales bacterium]|nr:RNA polymerase factor sigma-54 [Bacteroidales bacterium]MDD4216478.1 RNA polymerase factor sigma-54 [Bacteroidales bacterium]MDY0141804.1 RNA polymerase factor sigma-54 [Bacteroidales bacterium]